MRTTTPTIDAALLEDVMKLKARLTVYKSRIFFDTPDLITTDVPDSTLLYSDSLPMPEAISHNASIGEYVTIFPDLDGNLAISLVTAGSHLTAKQTGVEFPIGKYNRPSIFGNYVFARNDDDGKWYRIQIDFALVEAGNDECIVAVEEIEALNDYLDTLTTPVNPYGAISATSATDGVLFFIDEGAIGFIYFDHTANTINHAPGRLFKPTEVYKKTEIYAEKLHYSTAVKVGDTIFAYFSHYTGEVKGVSFKNKHWSDFFTAVPTDLSEFKISNAFVHNSNVFLCGSFSRKEQFSSEERYTLFLKSLDGKTFSLDAKTLVSYVKYRFFAATNGETLIFSSAKRHYETQAHYQVIGEATTNITLALKTVNGSENGWTVNLVSGDERYFNEEIIFVGAYARMDIGIYTSAGLEWLKYHDVAIGNVKRGVGDGVREMGLNIVPDAKFHTSQMTYPFYIEMQGRQSMYTDATVFDKLYKLSSDAGVEWAFTIDFWDTDAPGAAFGPREHVAGSTTTHMSVDLLKAFKVYPKFGDAPTYRAKIYGWSRAGKQDTNPNTDDPTPVTTPNDDFRLVVEMMSPLGVKSTWVSDGASLASAYEHPPQTYFIEGARDGSYPVEYDIPNPGEGTQIIRVGVQVINSTGKTLYHVERVDIPGITAVYASQANYENTSFQIEEATASWALVEELTLTITDANAVDGNKVVTTQPLKPGYCYSIAIVGDVGFERDGYTWIQDAEFTGKQLTASSPFVEPLWTRTYPPGIGLLFNSSVRVKSTEFPYFGLYTKPVKEGVQTRFAPVVDHKYTFKHADERFRSSSIRNTAIPYVYSDGDPIEIALYLAGSGAITNIKRGVFKVYVFESPVPFTKFRYHKGVGRPAGTFKVIENTRTAFDPDQDYSTYLSFQTKVTSGTDNGEKIRIRPVFGTDLKITMKFKMQRYGFGDTFITSMWNQVLFGSSSVYFEDEEISLSSHWYETNNIVELHYDSTEDVYIDQSWWYPYPWAGVEYEREVTIEVLAVTPWVPQVPVPPSFILTLPDGTVIADPGINTTMKTMQKGTPQVLYATAPYSAYNFEATVRCSAKGHAKGGIVCLGIDEDNYIAVYFHYGAEIAVVRDGISKLVMHEDLPNQNYDDLLHDLRVRHQDGLFTFDVKYADGQWGTRGKTDFDVYGKSSGTTYRWREEDGPLCASDDIFHLGVYGLINPPHFRTMGHVSSSGYIGVLPCDINPSLGTSDFEDRWIDTVGYQVDIQGVIYNYGAVSRKLKLAGKHPMGPYQIRNTESWDSPYNDDRNGKTYQGGKAVEIGQFQWLNGTTHAELFKDVIVSSSGGYSWLLDESQWKVWIKTGGAVVWLRNRARHYSDEIPDYFADGYDRFFLTDGLLSVTPTVEAQYQHPYGSFVYLHSGEYVIIAGFMAVSLDADQSVSNLIEKISRTSGTDAIFLGDQTIASVSLDDGEDQVLNG